MKIGIDLVDIYRIDEGLIKKICSSEETEYLEKFNYKLEHIAGFFAVKEALIKALDLGDVGLNFKEVKILHSNTGKPYIKLEGKFLEEFNKLEEQNIEISISHEKSIATAIVILY